MSCDSRPGVKAELDVAASPSSDILVEWNRRLLEVAEAEDGFLTLKGLRSVTLFHLAVRDALGELSADPSMEGAIPLAVVAGAGYRMASSQYPDLDLDWQALRDRWADQVQDLAARQRSLELGAASAERLLAEREADGWSSEASYQWHPMAPGVYAEFNEHSGTPEGFIFGAGWAQVTPFALDSPDQFVSPPPPEISSPEYAAAFDEVKSVGRFESEQRTADQSHLAMWWKEFVESSHNRLGRELVSESKLGLAEANRFFVLLNVGIHDAYVSSFYNKFLYNHWRPYTAIRWAEHDGNPATEPDPEWDNLHRHTYAFPSYPSAHGTACAAAMTAFEDTFGETRPFTMSNPEVESAGPFSDKIVMDPPSRSFESFAQAAEECAVSRVYLGIHFRYDSVAGTELGREVGRRVLERFG
jgi:hypothetical protein